MKVWVPIDLPVGHKVDYVTIQSIPKNALEVPIIGSIRPIGPFRRIDDEAMERPTEPKRDRWEYRVNQRDGAGASHNQQVMMDQWGSEGWECCGVTDHVVFFKRKLP